MGLASVCPGRPLNSHLALCTNERLGSLVNGEAEINAEMLAICFLVFIAALCLY